MSNPDPLRDYADYAGDVPAEPVRLPGDCPACPGVGLVQATIYEYVCVGCGIRWEVGDQPTREDSANG